MPLSQLEVADTTGLTEAYVNRLFQSMRARGRIELSRGGIQVREVKAFSREVNFEPRYLSAHPLQPPVGSQRIGPPDCLTLCVR